MKTQPLSQEAIARLGLLYRLWNELPPDLADWMLRSERLEILYFGSCCLDSIIKKITSYLHLLSSLGIDPQQLQNLDKDHENILGEMADATSPNLFLISLTLFWDDALAEGAQQWVQDFSSAMPGHALLNLIQIAKPVFSDEFRERILKGLFVDEMQRAEAFRWSGHLVDVISAAGGFSLSDSTRFAPPITDYCWEDKLPVLDSRFLQWSPTADTSSESKIVLQFVVCLKRIFTRWRELEHLNEMDKISRFEKVLHYNSQFVSFVEAIWHMPDASFPLAISSSAFQDAPMTWC